MHRTDGSHCLAVRGRFHFIHRFLCGYVATCLIAGIAISGVVPAALAESPIFHVDIKAGPAQESLYAFAMQTGLMIVLVTAGSPDEPPPTNAVSGSFSALDALDQMLIDTGLTYALVGRGKFEVRRAIGGVHWYDIQSAAALVGLRAYVKTAGRSARVNRALAQGERFAAVHGCFTAENAARQLLAGSPFTDQWIPELDEGSPPYRDLILRPVALRQRIARLFDRDTWFPVRPTLRVDTTAAYCFRLCESESESQQPPLTCAVYSTPIP